MKGRSKGCVLIMVRSSVEFCKNEGIARHHTVRNTPQQNGIAERMNQTLLERARCMLSNGGLAKRFKAEAVSTACHVINRGPHTNTVKHLMRWGLVSLQIILY